MISPFQDVFKKGRLYRGIFCPSLTNSFANEHLESLYLIYSRHQRQKSLIMLNLMDVALKVWQLSFFFKLFSTNLGQTFHFWRKNLQITLTLIWLFSGGRNSDSIVQVLLWVSFCVSLNLAVCALGWLGCCSVNYLYWGSIFTWLLINSQGNSCKNHTRSIWLLKILLGIPKT